MTSTKSLTSIAEFYKTDKYEHGYTKVYEKYCDNFRDEKLKILEIGIADGKSLLTLSISINVSPFFSDSFNKFRTSLI